MVQAAREDVVNTRAMILAAGFGKRMRPLTDNLPKPLIVVGGRSMLERTFQHLTHLGIKDVVVNTHYLPHLLEEKARTLWPSVKISHEDEILETGGGIKKALPLLGEAPFFTLNGDSVWTHSEGLKTMEKTWDDKKMDALLLLLPKEKAHGYEGDGDFSLSSSGTLTRPQSSKPAPLVYIGVQLVHPRLFLDSPEGAFSMNLLWNKALDKGRLYGMVHEGDWYHLSTPHDVEKYDSKLKNS